MDESAKSNAKPTIAAIIVAAGSGARLDAALPKAYVPVGGVPLLHYSLSALAHHPAITHIVVVASEDHDSFTQETRRLWPHLIWAKGGATRSDSVKSGLNALAAFAPEIVLIHDAARPFLFARVCDELIANTTPTQAAMPVLSVPDTVRRFDNGAWHDVERAALMRVQTPQSFPYAPLRDAYDALSDAPSDDIAVWQRAKGVVASISGDEMLKKITYPEDVLWAERQLARAVHRTASGYDVHRLIPAAGGRIRLGGMDIAHDYMLEGHSDADVVLHALTDALLGTLSNGDIGSHFPPSNAAHKNRNSADFVRAARDLIAKEAGRITHIDITIICEAPKISPHREQMRGVIAELLSIPLRSVSVKATTTEKLGFTGRGEGIAAQAIATVMYPEGAL